MSKGTNGRITGVFRTGADIDIRNTQSGATIGNLRAVSTSGYGNREASNWITIVLFRENDCEFLAKYAGKGSKVFVDGELVCRKWNDRDGNERLSVECHVGFGGVIEVIDGKNGTEHGDGNASQSSNKPAPEPDPDLDDDVPF